PGISVKTANITSDPDTGLGKWSDDDIKKAITTGVDPKGNNLSPPMPYPFFKNMTAEDLDAVVAYIRTLPPIKNQVERTDFQKKALPQKSWWRFGTIGRRARRGDPLPSGPGAYFVVHSQGLSRSGGRAATPPAVSLSAIAGAVHRDEAARGRLA